MNKLFAIKPWQAYAAYAVLDIICVGIGMGVPIMAVLFGFVVGWYITRAALTGNGSFREVVGKFLPQAMGTAAFTFGLMLIIWAPWTVVLWDASTDYVELGIPMILFEPRLSFIGWQLLMIFVSPFLQVLSTLFGSHLTLLVWSRRQAQGN